MFCPKCSQQLVSEELRFCSRCGFPLSGVALLLDNDGQVPSAENSATQSGRRGRIIKESVTLILVSWVIAFVGTTLWDMSGPIETVAKVGSLIFFVLGLLGLLRFLYAFLVVKDPAPSAPVFQRTANRSALPPPQVNPLSDYPRRSQTKDMVPRGSVTENTTRLLDEDR